MTEKRKVSLRRDLNDLIRGPDGKVSPVKLGSATGQAIAAYLLLIYADKVLSNWDVLTVLFATLVLPDSLKKIISMKYGGKE